MIEHYLRKAHPVRLEHCPPPARVLDVGCGTGALAARLAERGYEVVGLDPSRRDARGDARACARDVAACRASATEMPFADGEFDLSLSVATMHHIADPDAVRRALAEMVRVARPGRPDHRLGPQPAQPVLAVPDEAGAAGHRRRAPDRPRASCSAGSRPAAPSRCW